ncbi:MAG: hypothetical protein HYY18_16770 [Planctomycetes bacterium]|nr:hypothetical protein [Planctomycetota bacterium]
MLRVLLALAVCAARVFAEEAQEVVLRPKGVDANFLNPCEIALDGKRHLAYLRGNESAALGVLDVRTLGLKGVPLPAPARAPGVNVLVGVFSCPRRPGHRSCARFFLRLSCKGFTHSQF